MFPFIFIDFIMFILNVIHCLLLKFCILCCRIMNKICNYTKHEKESNILSQSGFKFSNFLYFPFACSTFKYMPSDFLLSSRVSITNGGNILLLVLLKGWNKYQVFNLILIVGMNGFILYSKQNLLKLCTLWKRMKTIAIRLLRTHFSTNHEARS